MTCDGVRARLVLWLGVDVRYHDVLARFSPAVDTDTEKRRPETLRAKDDSRQLQPRLNNSDSRFLPRNCSELAGRDVVRDLWHHNKHVRNDRHRSFSEENV